MYNSENVRRIKIGIRIFFISLVVVPSILLVSSLAKSAGLQDKLESVSQTLSEAQTQLENKAVHSPAPEGEEEAEIDPDFIVAPGEFYNPCGKAILNIAPQMIVDWRMEPTLVSEQPTVYLTFDDGPSALTPPVLDILDKYGIKATFFVVGNDDEYIHNLYRETVERGHAIGMHSYSHDYKTLYQNTQTFVEDFDKLFTVLKETTGETPVLYRFPGGANNDRLMKNELCNGIVEEMASRGFIYHDWNVSGEDASFVLKNKETIVENVVNGVMGKKHAVVLLHNSANKHTTVEALPAIIETLQARGYRFDKLTSAIKPIHFA